MATPPSKGVEPIALPGFDYLPRFITDAEGQALIDCFANLTPLWERRHQGAQAARDGAGTRRLTRPVYWLGAWQFACLGYYAEPDHLHEKCLRAEPLPAVMQAVLERLRPTLAAHLPPGAPVAIPNTCLINYYGSELQTDHTGRSYPIDYARLRMHKDGEPGPVVMFSIGQPALFEFVEPQLPDQPALSTWLKNRSVVILSGPRFKDHLYHRVTRVRYGPDPVLTARVPDFKLRRVSVSFRYVPEARIKPLIDFSPAARAQIEPYVEQLAEHSPHFRQQLATARGA